MNVWLTRSPFDRTISGKRRAAVLLLGGASFLHDLVLTTTNGWKAEMALI
jgi:hypothetical protein